MKDKKYTPGPWKIESGLKSAISAGSKHIAMVNFYHCGDPTQDVFGEEHAANARLIAAAPDLLEALEAVVKPYKELPQEVLAEVAPEWWEQVQTAIAKAKGEV